VFCIVVIPGDVIEIQKSEHLVTVLLKAIDQFPRRFARTEPVGETLVESIDENPMFSQKTFLEAALIHRLNHRLHQASEVPHELLELFVVRVLQQLVVQVTDDMNQTFLLWALYCIVRCAIDSICSPAHRSDGSLIGDAFKNAPLDGQAGRPFADPRRSPRTMFTRVDAFRSTAWRLRPDSPLGFALRATSRGSDLLTLSMYSGASRVIASDTQCRCPDSRKCNR
jgi:hypothetical protein